MAGTVRVVHKEREDQRMVLYPLAKELKRLVTMRFGSNRAADRTLGLPENTTQRITSSTTQGFDYLNVTRLMGAVGLTPNEAAALVGLYENKDEGSLTPEERQLLELFRTQKTDEQRKLILFTARHILHEWNEQVEPAT